MNGEPLFTPRSTKHEANGILEILPEFEPRLLDIERWDRVTPRSVAAGIETIGDLGCYSPACGAATGPGPHLRDEESPMKRLPVLAVISILLTSCALHEFTTDISKDPRGQAAVGHCFSLRRDAFILKAPRHVTIKKPDADELNVYGVISLWSGAETDPRQVLKLPAGTHVTVERVLSRYSPSIGDSVTTYGRMNGKFDNLYIDSSELFEFTFSKDPVVPVRAYVERCD